ncbi:hypothetical protein K0504_12905 [Neiella marina]|uniref:Uncharacterized protein n=1 Tax=Neiella holothuriorum TaxID=2870530 RepID=A0ABS7EHW1_9GAMM|nr:hypothetical protein [Neiella holothuriorum]MBW8191938.1 hypothetical protein [Neiella holothuriorum]
MEQDKAVNTHETKDINQHSALPSEPTTIRQGEYGSIASDSKSGGLITRNIFVCAGLVGSCKSSSHIFLAHFDSPWSVRHLKSILANELEKTEKSGKTTSFDIELIGGTVWLSITLILFILLALQFEPENIYKIATKTIFIALSALVVAYQSITYLCLFCVSSCSRHSAVSKHHGFAWKSCRRRITVYKTSNISKITVEKCDSSSKDDKRERGWLCGCMTEKKESDSTIRE